MGVECALSLHSGYNIPAVPHSCQTAISVVIETSGPNSDQALLFAAFRGDGLQLSSNL